MSATNLKESEGGSQMWGKDVGLQPIQSETAGTSVYEYQAHFFSQIASVVEYIGIHRTRPEGTEAGFYISQSVDNQTRPPAWMETRDVAIDGSPLTDEEKGSKWFEHKYCKEFEIAEMVQAHRKHEELFVKHDLAGSWRGLLRYFNMWEPAVSREEVMRRGAALQDSLIEEAKKETPEEEQKKLDWNSFVSAMEGDKPLVHVAKQYRNVYDVYGIDQFLDSWSAVLWLAFKIGSAIGIAQGGTRALKALHADVQYTKASGIGALTFMNVSLFTGIIKWGGNITACALMFCIGDWLCKLGKYTVQPDDLAEQRTPVNYAVGMSCAFGTVGIMPWWLLSDARMGLRLTASGMFIGAGVGFAFGWMLEQMVAVNLNRLKYSPGQFRVYTALMKREKISLEMTLDRLRRSGDFEGM